MLIDQSLQGRHALVCGASRGIGRATAHALAAAGASVTALARDEAALVQLCAELPGAAYIVADLDDLDGLAAVVDALLQRHPVHILVNNTGGPPGGPLLDALPQAFLTGMTRHVLASHVLAQRLVPGMAAAGYGRIVNVISTSVYEPIPNLGVSNTVRGAMAAWSKSLSRELPPGVTINNVLPGFTDTDRLTELAEGRAAREGVTPDDVRAAWLSQVPEGRLARPEETAATIAFLASPAAAYIRGQSIAVDGGRLRSI